MTEPEKWTKEERRAMARALVRWDQGLEEACREAMKERGILNVLKRLAEGDNGPDGVITGKPDVRVARMACRFTRMYMRRWLIQRAQSADPSNWDWSGVEPDKD